MSPLLTSSLLLSVSLPFLVAVALMALRNGREAVLSKVSIWGAVTWMLACALTIAIWLGDGARTMELDLGTLYHSGSFTLPALLLFDLVSATFLGVSALLGTLIVKYCRYYLHREEGYARFFITVFFFLGGMGLISCAGTFEILFAGWEVVGATSFLLIGFYRDRPTPQRNALRAFVVYRVCDVGLLLGAWLGHLVWHETRSFFDLARMSPSSFVGIGFLPLLGLSFLVLLAASGKSAQFPFSSWLPRAMEGPTPSSAIFYGALSVHAGVLLLLRTYPIWHALWVTRVMVGGLGIVSAATASLMGRVQSNIKAQIGYASIAQIGLMLLELSLGLTRLALFHFVANAMLRCYQLLVSPSVVAHLLRVQAASSQGIRLSDWSLERRTIPRKLQTTLYAFALGEGYLDHMASSIFGSSWKLVSRLAAEVGLRGSVGLALVALMGLVGGVSFWAGGSSESLEVAFALGMIAASLSALMEQEVPHRAWAAIAMSSVMACAAVLATGDPAGSDVVVHLAGIGPSWLLGAASLYYLTGNAACDLRWNHGLAQTRPLAAFLFFLSALGISGFPITTAFLGEDLLLHHVVRDDLWLALAITVGFVLNGIVAMTLYTRVCLGPLRRDVAA